jgi:hypothetical protein
LFATHIGYRTPVERTPPIATYTNDHLGGSAGALDLLSTLRSHAHSAEFERVLDGITAAIEADRNSLLEVMQRLGVEPGWVKQAGARVGEKVMRVKSSNLVTGDEDLSRLLELEALCIGIAGKRAGWLALRAADRSELADVDLDGLIARADDQRERLEPHRLEAANAALGHSSGV